MFTFAGPAADADVAPRGTKYSANSAVIRIAKGFGIPRLVMDRTIKGTSRRNGSAEVGLTSGSPRPSSAVFDARGDRKTRSRLTAPPACADLSPDLRPLTVGDCQGQVNDFAVTHRAGARVVAECRPKIIRSAHQARGLHHPTLLGREVSPPQPAFSVCFRQRMPASMNSSISPSRTAPVLPVSCSVRRSLTIWYGCST